MSSLPHQLQLKSAILVLSKFIQISVSLVVVKKPSLRYSILAHLKIYSRSFVQFSHFCIQLGLMHLQYNIATLYRSKLIVNSIERCQVLYKCLET